jgi:hypothetical protein
MRGLPRCLAVALILAVAFAACTREPSPEGTVDAAPTPPAAPTDARLDLRAAALYEHLSEERWAEAYTYLTPELRAGCPVEEFTSRMARGWAFAKSVLRVEEDERLLLRVERVEVEGQAGRVFTELSYRGESLGVAEDEFESWVFADGDWAYDMVVAEDGCPAGADDAGG